MSTDTRRTLDRSESDWPTGLTTERVDGWKDGHSEQGFAGVLIADLCGLFGGCTQGK